VERDAWSVDEARQQRGATLAVMAAAALLGLALVSGGAASSGTSTSASTDRLTNFVDLDAMPATTTTPPASTTSAPVPTTISTTNDVGALPQTDERPSASGSTFTAGVAALWQAIRQDRPELGLPFFFPQRAYLQAKAINDPATDYQQRLIANFEADVHTLHAQLGANAANAEFVGVDVPDGQAVLVRPGEEYNKLSYWRVYGTTMEYRVDGRTGSFPVTSLISWRGQWYVVHLGAIR
jgi:hypothetical protein